MTSSRRLTRDDWIAAARKALIASGIDDVKVDLLARRLRMTRGSFYWHFKHRKDLLNALIADWEARNRVEIETVQGQLADAGSLVELFRVWLDADPSFPAFDMAVRVWARKAPAVAKVVHEIDDAWIALFQAFFERSGMSAPESFVRARVIYFHQIGYYALAIHESVTERARLAPYYYQALTGQDAPEGLVETLLAAKSRTRKTSRRVQRERAASDIAVEP